MELNDRDAYLTIDLPDGRVVDVVPLTFGRARIAVSQNRQVRWYEDGW